MHDDTENLRRDYEASRQAYREKLVTDLAKLDGLADWCPPLPMTATPAPAKWRRQRGPNLKPPAAYVLNGVRTPLSGSAANRFNTVLAKLGSIDAEAFARGVKKLNMILNPESKAAISAMWLNNETCKTDSIATINGIKITMQRNTPRNVRILTDLAAEMKLSFHFVKD